MFNRLGGQRWLEGPIQRRVNDLNEFTKPISVQDLQDAVSEGAKPLAKEDPALAKAAVEEAVKAAVFVIKDKGEFTLSGLEDVSGMLALAGSGLGKMMSNQESADRAQAAQLGVALLMTLLTDWVNKGRPELAQDRKMTLDLNQVRDAALKQLDPDKAGYVDNLVAAFKAKNPGGTISMRQLESFHDEINAQKSALSEKADQRKAAGLKADPAAADLEHSLVLQSLGAYALSDFLTFSADQGEIAKFAAQVKPGAAQALAGAAS